MFVLLYNPPSSASRKPVLPMSLLALGAVIEGHHEYQIIDGNLDPDPLATLDRSIVERSARVLAVTVMPGPQLESAVPLCRRLKAMHPDLIIVWGGYFPTQHYEACLRSSFVSYVLRGHNEMGFLALLDALDQHGEHADATKIPGIAYRHPLQIKTNPLPPIPSPNDLPDFPYHRVDVERYVRPTFMGRRTMPHHSSYGCPFTCNFCAVVNMVNGRWLPQSAERTARVVEQLVERFRVDAVDFHDNNFFTHEARTLEFAERIERLGVGWWGEARVDTLLKYDDRTWHAMRRSGLKMVFLGAESGSDEVLRSMNKGGTQTAEKALELAVRMKSYDVVPEMSFVVGNPPEPERDAEQTLEFIRRVKCVNPSTEIILYIYTPVPLSGVLYDQAVASGFAFPQTLEEWVSDAWREFAQRRSAERLPWLEAPLERRLRNFQTVLNAYFPTRTDRNLGRLKRALLRSTAAWRYHLKFYTRPIEIRALNRIMPHQRPETTGF